MSFRHVVSIVDFLDRALLDDIFNRAATFQKADVLHALDSSLDGHQVVTLFYEPSTRTRMSFEIAVHKLGGKVVSSENAGQFSSAIKGETLEDTVSVLSGYRPLAIVMRHTEIGSAKRAADALDVLQSKTCIINAGDGAGEHPTQALLDAYTIQRELGKIDGKSVAFVGDLKYGRTVHSLVQLLGKYDVKVSLVSPKQLTLPENYMAVLGEKVGEITQDVGAAKRADVVYVTRVQKERFEDEAEYEKCKASFVIDAKFMGGLKKTARVMHPLPRVTELAKEVDTDPRAAYFRQASNGLYVRMALLQMIAERERSQFPFPVSQHL